MLAKNTPGGDFKTENLGLLKTHPVYSEQPRWLLFIQVLKEALDLFP